MSRPTLLGCGTRARYVAGCRCPDCVDANRRYHRDHRFPTGIRQRPPQLATTHMPPMHWAEHAACRGLDGELFHPERGQSNAEAKAICNTCPVKTECLDWALTTHQAFGVWGGTSEQERKQIRRQRQLELTESDHRRVDDVRPAPRFL